MWKRFRSSLGAAARVLGVAALAALALAEPAGAQTSSGPAEEAGAEVAERPALVVVIAVDQLRRDRLSGDTAQLPGGLGRLVREGLVFSNATLAHAASETCPGHAALLTGRQPGVAGLPANYFVDRASGEGRYCVEDDPDAAAVLGSALPLGRSPRLMRTDALGDWMKRADPESRVYTVSAKDRAAIALGGQHPDGVFWLLRNGRIGFTSSRYYARDLPTWVRDWNRGSADDPRTGLLRNIPEVWVHDDAPTAEGRRDATPGESKDYRQTSGHPLRDDDPVVFIENVYHSPFVDELTLHFAERLVSEYGLGSDEAPDLLAVSLSATDTVGHLYGPGSHESRDALERLDLWLADFLIHLEARVGAGRILVALSSDHGVLPLPEWTEATGRTQCPVPGGRVSLEAMRRSLFWHMHFELGPWYGWPRAWLRHTGTQITVDRARASAAGREVDEVIAVAESWLEARPEIATVWTATELAASADPIAQAFRNSRDPERSGDLAIQVESGCLLTTYVAGTGHGAPYDYDRDVPLVLWGTGVRPGVSDGAAASVDLAPTLAHKLGIDVPEDLDGRSLQD